MTPDPVRTPALVGWRLLALAYDALPAVALWLLVAAAFTLAFHLSGHASAENIAPFSGWQWLIWCVSWAVTGCYAVASWRRGGQTLGMRPWRLHLTGTGTLPPTARALWLRYAVGTVSLLAGGLGFWWAWIDRNGLAWHDRASATRLSRSPRGGGTAAR